MSNIFRFKDYAPIDPPDQVLRADDPRGLIQSDGLLEVVRSDIDMDSMDRLISEAISNVDQYKTALDSAIAVTFHQTFRISRREAADRRLWAWLGLVKYPHFVAWRWKPTEGRDEVYRRVGNRFSGNAVRQTFARLWWAAELTVSDGRDYGLTGELLALSGFQDTYEAIFGRAFCHHYPAIASFVRVVGKERELVIREVAKEFGFLLTTVTIEPLSEIEVSDHLERIVEKVKHKVAKKKQKGAAHAS